MGLNNCNNKTQVGVFLPVSTLWGPVQEGVWKDWGQRDDVGTCFCKIISDLRLFFGQVGDEFEISVI
jgi:hypothetical protein